MANWPWRHGIKLNQSIAIRCLRNSNHKRIKFLGFFFLDIIGIVPLDLNDLSVLVWPPLVDLTFPLVDVGEHNVGHILARLLSTVIWMVLDIC